MEQKLLHKSEKAQAAVDFLISYGIAIIIIIIAVAIIYNISIAHPQFATPQCTAYSGFSCGTFSIATNGSLYIQLAQSTGGPITILGVACSSQINTTANGPAFGNIHVNGKPTFYPLNDIPGNQILSSGASNTFIMYCYNSGGIAASQLDQPFTGYIWLNYTVPTYGNTIQLAAALTVRYS